MYLASLGLQNWKPWSQPSCCKEGLQMALEQEEWSISHCCWDRSQGLIPIVKSLAYQVSFRLGFTTLFGITGAAKRKSIKPYMEVTERASRWLWIRRSDPWSNATGTQARVSSTLAEQPEQECMMLKDPKLQEHHLGCKQIKKTSID